MSTGGSRYFLLFIDEASNYRSVYFLKHASDVFERFKEFERMVANKFGRNIMVLKSDNGKEYLNTHMDDYLKGRDIRRECTARYTPEQNGKAERENRTIVEPARTMIHAKGITLRLWAKAVNTAVCILNRTLVTRGMNQTPYEIWWKKKPNMAHTKIFGTETYAYIDQQHRTKLDRKATKLIFVGYEGDFTNYRLYDAATDKVKISRHASCNENLTPTVNESPGLHLPKDDCQPLNANNDVNIEEADKVIGEEDNEYVEEQAFIQLLPPQPQRQLRDRDSIRLPKRYEANLTQYNVPETFQEAVSGPESTEWSKAIKKELEAHQRNNTWTIVEKTANQLPIDSKWVFKVTRDADDVIQKRKARLCARGFNQQYDSLRVLLALVTQLDWEVAQFDIMTAFLYGELEEDIFMKIPEGMEVTGASNSSVCLLNKSLYGLKQVPQSWNKKFRSFLKGGDHWFGPKWKAVFGNLFQPNNASKSIYCVV